MRELCFTARNLPANEALAAGLVSQVHKDQASLLAAARALATHIATKSPIAVMGTKHNLNYARDHTVEEGLNYISVWNMAMLQVKCGCGLLPSFFAAGCCLLSGSPLLLLLLLSLLMLLLVLLLMLFVLLCFCAHGFGQVIDDNPVVSISCAQSNDVTEAISSHMEKRKPVFAKL